MQIPNEVSELRLLFEVSQILEGASELSDNLDTVLEVVARYTGMMRGVISLLDERRGEIAIEVAYGISPEAKSRGRYKMGEGITGMVIQSGKPMIIPNISKEPLFLNRTGSRNLQKEEIAFICVPIKTEGRVIGALSADRLFGVSVALEEDMRVLSILASLVARAVKTRQAINAMRKEVLEENTRLQNALKEQFKPGAFAGVSASLQTVLAQLAQVAGTSATVLIRGESGTGKELVAKTIHANSPRAGQPMVCVNCAALPGELAESELFGHEKGAFTGATGTRKGRFEAATGGTIFLDEIGELPISTQAKLLRVLQEHELQRVGSSDTMKVDVRVVAATNRDLEKMVADNLFRQDLYYRLNVFPIYMPPLRERKDDIPPLVNCFLDKYGSELGKPGLRVAPETMVLLSRYEWPGNIRELENIIERAVILTMDGIIRPQHLPAALQPLNTCQLFPKNLPQAVEQLELKLISEALRDHEGNMGKAAAELGISERIMGLRMKKFGLHFKQFRKNR